MIDSWIDGSNQLKCLKINAGEKLVIHSSVGEWHGIMRLFVPPNTARLSCVKSLPKPGVNSMFDDDDDWNQWKEYGLENYINLGKFRSDPCAMNNYSWMEWPDIFNCIYSKCEPSSENNIIGLVTFIYSKKI
jgi:hypothetical protein